jgi:hypothetical protein
MRTKVAGADARAPLDRGADMITRALGSDHYRNWRAAAVRARCSRAEGRLDVARVEPDRARSLLERAARLRSSSAYAIPD